jgi:hypothetical protein
LDSESSKAVQALVRAASAAYDRKTTEDLKRISKEIIADPAAPALALMIAARHILGEGFTIWEPETLWRELDPPMLNKGKLAAAIALDIMPSFYWDYRVFASTIIVLNDGIAILDQIPQPTPLEMTWGVFDAEVIFALTTKEAVTPEFDDEPSAFAAMQLYEAGWVYPPANMLFCEENLLKLLSDEAHQLHDDVKRQVEAHKEDITSVKAEDVQLARLADSQLYVVNRTNAVADYLKKL